MVEGESMVDDWTLEFEIEEGSMVEEESMVDS